MHMIKALKALAIALPMIASSLLVAPQVAQAAPSDCWEPGNFCAWNSDNWGGRRVRWNQGVNDNNWGLHRGMHDDAESLHNNAASSQTRADNVQTYWDNGYGHTGPCLLPGESVDNLWLAENELDSHQWIHSCP
jgi:peptidase inhibitor family I36